MVFEKLRLSDEGAVEEMSAIATAIVREHYDPILGKEQNDYMLKKFQSYDAIRGQLEQGYRYYFVGDKAHRLGFMAFYPRGEAMYLSKLYLYKDERGKGYSRRMIDFVAAEARAEGLSAIELNVNRFNGSVDIYEKLGFTRIRSEKIDIGSGYYMDDYVYSLPV